MAVLGRSYTDVSPGYVYSTRFSMLLSTFTSMDLPLRNTSLSCALRLNIVPISKKRQIIIRFMTFYFYTLPFPLQGFLYHNYFERGNIRIPEFFNNYSTYTNIQRLLFNALIMKRRKDKTKSLKYQTKIRNNFIFFVFCYYR